VFQLGSIRIAFKYDRDMMTRVAAVAAALLLASAGCTSGSDSAGDKSAAEKTAAKKEPAKKSRCLKVNQVTIDAISKEVEGGITKGAAVKSKDFKNVYMVAAKITTGDVAVWATNDDPTDDKFQGAVQAAEGFAHEFSTWPKGDANITTDGVKQAKDCLS
jgi:hypothetical protein